MYLVVAGPALLAYSLDFNIMIRKVKILWPLVLLNLANASIEFYKPNLISAGSLMKNTSDGKRSHIDE